MCLICNVVFDVATLLKHFFSAAALHLVSLAMPAGKAGRKASSASKPAHAIDLNSSSADEAEDAANSARIAAVHASKAASSADKPALPSRGSAASKAASSADKPASTSSASESESEASSAAKMQITGAPHPDHCLIAFYNITWHNGRLTCKNHEQHEKTLAEDLDVALKSYKADVVLLSECGEIEKGLIEKYWLPLVRKLAGPGFAVKHQSHYTSIVRLSTVEIMEGPKLMGPMATWQGLHDYRKCQVLSIAFKDSADKPITEKPVKIFNVHSPSSKHHPLIPTVRKEILQWLLEHVGDRALIGGDLKSSRMALDDQFQNDPGLFYLCEEDHLHGDVMIAKGVQATSVACNVSSTSKAHEMCMVMVQLQSDSGEKAQAMEDKHPLVDALFSELGAHLDAGEAERKLYNDLAEKLWSGQFFHDMRSADKPAKPARHPSHAKARLELLLRKSIDVRERYQRRLFDNGREISDLDFKRSLDNDETKAIHNAWMNQVDDWMSAECLQTYDHLLEQAEEVDAQAKKGKRKEKPPKGRKKGSAAKPADKGKGKGSGAKAAEKWIHPRQQAQQLKKQRFNKITNDLACNKSFFLSFVRHPATRTAQGIQMTLQTMADIKESKEYTKMVESSTKKNEEQQLRKRERDKAHVLLKHARRDGVPDDVHEATRAYKKARVAYTELRKPSGLRHGQGLSSYLHGDDECLTEIEPM